MEPGMGQTFGIAFTIVLASSVIYWAYRMWRQRIQPVDDYSPLTLTFAEAARLAAHVARDRVLAEAPTVRITLPMREDGTYGTPERPLDVGAETVDIGTRLRREPRHAAPDLTGAA